MSIRCVRDALSEEISVTDSINSNNFIVRIKQAAIQVKNLYSVNTVMLLRFDVQLFFISERLAVEKILLFVCRSHPQFYCAHFWHCKVP